LYFVIHYVWYSKWIFGTEWAELSGTAKSAVAKKRKSVHLLGNLLIGLIYSYFIALFAEYLNVETVIDGMFLAFSIWLGFVVTTIGSSYVWTNKPTKLFFIQIGVKLLALLSMGGVIGA
jgi:hypothetical protein